MVTTQPIWQHCNDAVIYHLFLLGSDGKTEECIQYSSKSPKQKDRMEDTSL
jgi:hypothetical protein